MKKNVKRLMAALAVATVMTGAMPFSVFAANTYTELTGDSVVKLKKELMLDASANVPNVKFNYSITALDDNIDASSDTVEVLAPKSEQLPSITSTLTYQPDDSTVDYTDANYKEVSKDIVLDFSSVKFTEPGVYRYYIQEKGDMDNDTDKNQGITNDVKYDDTSGEFAETGAKGWRTLDVYVGDNSEEDSSEYTLVIENYVLYEGKQTGAPKSGEPGTVTKLDGDNYITATTANGGEVAGSTKSEGYVNVYDTSDITFGKRVEGNQGSKDKYFKFTVEIKNATEGTVYDVDISNADATVSATDATQSDYSNQTNPTTITVGEDGTVTQDFYLQHGQYITIQGVAKDTKYTITEVSEDYTTKVFGDFEDTDGTAGVENLDSYLSSGTTTALSEENKDVTEGNTITETVASDDLEYAFLNTRSGILPTGVIMSVAPVAVAGVGVLAAIIALLVRGKKRELEEE